MEKLVKIINAITTEEFRETFIEIYYYKNEPLKILIFLICLPFTAIFVIINFLVTVIFIIFYFSLFIKIIISVKIFKKKPKRIKYVRRFKFLKKFYPILFEKILIAIPKKRAFLVMYLLLRNIIKKDKSIFEKEIVEYYIKSISNRYFVVLVIGVPYILIYCNNWLVNIIFDLKGYEYESKSAFIGTLFLNIHKDLLPMYSKAVDKLKIKVNKNKIIFNFSKDIIKELKHRKDYVRSFLLIKKKTKFGMAKSTLETKNEIGELKIVESKEHFTASIKTEKGFCLSINETSRSNLLYLKYYKEINKYVREKLENNFIHKGTTNKGLKTFYTPLVLGDEKKIKFLLPLENQSILKNMKDDDVNNILAAMTLNLDNIFLEKKIMKINETSKEELTENIKINKTIEYIKNIKNELDSQTFEAILGMDFFWKENEKIIKNLSIEKKLELAQELGLGKNIDTKEINFQIFKNFLN